MSPPVPLLDLHRLVDARLSVSARRRVTDALEADADARARAEGWRADLDCLRQVFEPVAAEPLPLARALAARAAAGDIAAQADEPIRQGARRTLRRRRGGDAVEVRLGSRRDRIFVAVSAFIVGAAAALAGAAAFSALSGSPSSLIGAFWRLPVSGGY